MITLFKKITDLTPAITVKGTDTFEMVSRQAGTLESVEVTADQIASFVNQNVTTGVTIVTGSPFGVTVATPGKLIFDNTPPGALWLKTSGTDASGWLQLI